jgi:signal transduction histidine kinase
VAKFKSNVSLKSSITTALISISLLSLLFAILSTTLYSNEKNNTDATRFIKTISNIVSFNSQISLSSNRRNDLNDFLSTLKKVDEISNIHVYRVNEQTEELEFFVSFNQQGVPPIAPQFDKIKQLSNPVFTDNIVEYGIPVLNPKTSKRIGFVYLRMQLASYNDSFLSLANYNIVVAVFIALIAFFTSLMLRRRILSPINTFIKNIKDLTYNKDFNTQINSPQLTEMVPLANSVNAMLTRIYKQINKYAEAEKEITELNQNLEEKVVMRTQALRDSNQGLLNALEQVHQYQSQVIQSEKMASLGQMVAGVAHEVNTPIGLGVTASTMMSDRIDDVKLELEAQTLSAKKLEKFLDESKENTQIIYRNLSRAADLISSFKQVAVDQTADTVRNVKFNAFLHEIIMSLHPTLKQSKHEVVVNCDPALEASTKPGPINQIIINLIMNSIIHGFEDIDSGVIEITVAIKRNKCQIKLSDNGKGIEEKIKQKIFDPFVTTKRGEGGSGLGMHLVYNLVTQALSGSIEVESELGQGAHFTISFPVNKVYVAD